MKHMPYTNILNAALYRMWYGQNTRKTKWKEPPNAKGAKGSRRKRYGGCHSTSCVCESFSLFIFILIYCVDVLSQWIYLYTYNIVYLSYFSSYELDGLWYLLYSMHAVSIFVVGYSNSKMDMDWIRRLWLSREFTYFWSRVIKLPKSLCERIKYTVGSSHNAEYNRTIT